jgi:ABC-type antimicrobial peptide transport system permease subunit
MACAVEERTREFGVRLALGAMPRAILGSALLESARIGVTGSVLGAILVFVLARMVGTALYLVPGEHGGLLYGVRTTDPIALGAAFVTVIAVAMASGLLPARRATRIDPLVALRSE